LKAKAEAEKASLIKEWTAKVANEVKSARSDEQEKAQNVLKQTRKEFEDKIEVL